MDGGVGGRVWMGVLMLDRERVEVTEWVFMTVKVLDHALFPTYCKYPLILNLHPAIHRILK